MSSVCKQIDNSVVLQLLWDKDIFAEILHVKFGSHHIHLSCWVLRNKTCLRCTKWKRIYKTVRHAGKFHKPKLGQHQNFPHKCSKDNESVIAGTNERPFKPDKMSSLPARNRRAHSSEHNTVLFLLTFHEERVVDNKATPFETSCPRCGRHENLSPDSGLCVGCGARPYPQRTFDTPPARCVVCKRIWRRRFREKCLICRGGICDPCGGAPHYHVVGGVIFPPFCAICGLFSQCFIERCIICSGGICQGCCNRIHNH